MMALVKDILRRLARPLHDDHGAASISFILCLPIFYLIVAVIIQYALLVNARTMVEHAAHVAARSAMTALPDERSEAVLRAARFAVVPLCPEAQGAVDSEAATTADALAQCGVDVPDSFARRYTYAVEATRADWSGGGFVHNEGREIEVTVRYRFYLTVPVAAGLLSGRQETVGGVAGKFQDLAATVRVQASHGRKAGADGTGWPR
jgi:Flp pilus assembly protein TadG